MTSVGIRELKAQLSRYVRLAAEGETVAITDRGREVAVLAPARGRPDGLRALIDSGRVRWAGGKPGGADGVRLKGESIAKTVSDLRG